jgi:type II secretory pathway predicted ATPase ExeA
MGSLTEAMRMYRQYYGMSMNPFDKDIPAKDIFPTQDMAAMKGRLDHLSKHPGIGVFTALPGQGKTFSLRCFAQGLNPNIVKFYYICLSTVSIMEFYRQLCTVLGVDTSYKKSAMFRNLQEFFENMNANKHVHCIVCLDEAQYLSNEILRDLKMLCNFSMDSKTCFSLLLLGQPMLANTLMHQPHEALRQRIVINYRFQGLSEPEAIDYVKNRLALAGASPQIIDDSAILAAYGGAAGSVRKLNLIVTKALMIGAQHDKPNIDADIVLAAINDIELG